MRELNRKEINIITGAGGTIGPGPITTEGGTIGPGPITTEGGTIGPGPITGFDV